LKTYPGILVGGLLVASCAIVSPTNQSPMTVAGDAAVARPSWAHNDPIYFAYRIDPSIQGRRGLRGDFAFVYTGGQSEPEVIVFGDEYIVSRGDMRGFSADRYPSTFHADLGEPQPIPDVYDGRTALEPRLRHPLIFRTDEIHLDDMWAMGERARVSGGWVFSSERAAKICYGLLKMKASGSGAFPGFNYACVDTPCAPDYEPPLVYPSTEPRPSPSPTPSPYITPLRLLDFECRTNTIQLGDDAILHVRAWLPSSLRFVEVEATVDDERKEVRLAGIQRIPAGIGGLTVVTQVKVGVKFRPAKIGTYRVIGTIHPDLSPPTEPREYSCEVVVR
jgi:hypothetical protein